jgi:glutamate dehydrogenase
MNAAAQNLNHANDANLAHPPKFPELLARLTSADTAALPTDWDWAEAARLFYQHISPADWNRLGTAGQADGLLSMIELGANRTVGQPNCRLTQRDGVLLAEIVTDDMPFLVDSVTAVLNQAGLTVNLVIHPIMTSVRSGDGQLMGLAPSVSSGQASQKPLKGTAVLESWQQFYTTGSLAPAQLELIKTKLDNVLRDVRHAVSDWQPMRQRLKAMQAKFEGSGLPAQEIAEVNALLSWLDSGHFTFLGSRSLFYKVGAGNGETGQDSSREEQLVVVPDSGLGVLRDDSVTLFAGARKLSNMSAKAKNFMLLGGTLSIVKTSQTATVHRPVLMDAIGLRFYDDQGQLQEVCWFVGLFTSAVYVQSILEIPLLREKIKAIHGRSGFLPDSHNAKALMHILETLPRDELLQMDDETIYQMAISLLYLQDHQKLALFGRFDPLHRFVSCFIYVPRLAYSTTLEQKLVHHLEQSLGGHQNQLLLQTGESPFMRIHLVLKANGDTLIDPDWSQLEEELQQLAQSWEERLEALIRLDAPGLWNQYLQVLKNGFSLSYQERFTPENAFADLPYLLALSQKRSLMIHLSTELLPSTHLQEQRLKLKLFQHAEPVALADITPLLDRMGIRLINENPFRFVAGCGNGADELLFLNDITVALPVDVTVDAALAERVTSLLQDLWDHKLENDKLNRLTLTAGLTGREITVLRAYLKWLRQLGAGYNESYLGQSVLALPQVAVHIMHAFHARFDPNNLNLPVVRQQLTLVQQLLAEKATREQERILRSLVDLLQATVRTNYYQQSEDGSAKPCLSFKILGTALEWLPAPRPFAEIFVYSPLMEGVHLRGGKIARGGIRWSDRREDFRQEVLGLVKAQLVKNVVIVPVGAKGGFVVKSTPTASQSLADLGKQAYDLLIRGMLDITDNLVEGKVVPPPQVTCHDEDDHYLVVAADKGTATFSDRANAIAAEYNFWLGDAFASGGSKGYDHKKIGITSRGAWESVRRHFCDLGRNADQEELTVVGVGDMSGDVFGNGLLLSKNLKLVAAFNHQHIFLDPTPQNPNACWNERKRLFDLPRSSWEDYDVSLLSPGGQIIKRSAKNVTLDPAVAEWLGVDAKDVDPHDIIQSILRLPVDLLWLGGIGTYVKAEDETHLSVSDSVNDLVRINGHEVGAKVVAEGANVGFTQGGRVEYALKGGRINTDFIDNSGGVDCSDHEVNLKILFNQAELAGKLTAEERDALMVELTDEVVALILRNNRLQNLALSMIEQQAPRLVDAHGKLMRRLEQEGFLSRALNRLPSDDQLQERALRGQGLTRPELAVLMSHAKIALREQLREAKSEAQHGLVQYLTHYFPKTVRDRFAAEIDGHPLHQEIDLMLLTNSLINRLGLHRIDQLQESVNGTITQVAGGYILVRESFSLHRCWASLLQLDGMVDPAVLLEQFQRLADVVEQNCWWWVLCGGDDHAEAEFATVNQMAYAEVMSQLPELLGEHRLEQLMAEKQRLIDAGFPEEDAASCSALNLWHSGLMVLQEGYKIGLKPADACKLRWQLEDALQLRVIEEGLSKLTLHTLWEKRAVDALRRSLRLLDSNATEQLLRIAVTKGSADSWWRDHSARLNRYQAMLQELLAHPANDLAPYITLVESLRGL